MYLTRRQTLRGLGGVLAVGAVGLPRLTFANTGGERRLVVVLLRGGLDGLAAVAPVGDPNFALARPEAVELAESGAELDGMFRLHPALKHFGGFFRKRELAIVHAVASPYRERSHFDAQNILETGATDPYARGEGWLNVALEHLPAATAQPHRDFGVALASSMPLVLRGRAAVSSWSPSYLPAPPSDFLERVAELYRSDPPLLRALEKARGAQAVAGPSTPNGDGGAFASLARAAGNFLRSPNGPRIAVLESNGWDTHANQLAPFSPLNRNLAGLDGGIAVLAQTLGSAWAETLVVVVTEFGRTVALNGSRGTDHGTASVAFLLGGAVRGGQVHADWPGLATESLYEGRDLQPTTDLRAVLRGALRDHLEIPEEHLKREVFPASDGLRTLDGLTRA